ncbi:MAG: PDZ domain-containing protein, partial [Planctomycetota bacterium]
AHSIIADAMFVDPLAGDYRVKAESPALSVGFRNFPMDRFGVQKPALQQLAQIPPLPGTLEAAKIASGGWGRRYSKPKTASWLGARVKDLESDGEMSAVGLGDKDGVLVVEVPAGSLAAKEGFQKNDVIREFDGHGVKTLQDLADLRDKKASTATLELWRDQARCLLKLSEGER